MFPGAHPTDSWDEPCAGAESAEWVGRRAAILSPSDYFLCDKGGLSGIRSPELARFQPGLKT